MQATRGLQQFTKHWSSPRREVSKKQFLLTRCFHLHLTHYSVSVPWQLSNCQTFPDFPYKTGNSALKDETSASFLVRLLCTFWPTEYSSDCCLFLVVQQQSSISTVASSFSFCIHEHNLWPWIWPWLWNLSKIISRWTRLPDYIKCHFKSGDPAE